MLTSVINIRAKVTFKRYLICIQTFQLYYLDVSKTFDHHVGILVLSEGGLSAAVGDIS